MLFRSRPRSGGPRRKVCVLIFEFEQDGDGGVLNVLVVRSCLEVREDRAQCGRKRHNLFAPVHEVLVPELANDPPDGLHVPGFHGFVVIVEVDPASEPGDRLAPFPRVGEDDRPALVVVGGESIVFQRRAQWQARVDTGPQLVLALACLQARDRPGNQLATIVEGFYDDQASTYGTVLARRRRVGNAL